MSDCVHMSRRGRLHHHYLAPGHGASRACQSTLLPQHTRKVDTNNFDIAIVIITQLDHHFLSLIIKIPLILFFNIKPFIFLETDGKQAAPVF